MNNEKLVQLLKKHIETSKEMFMFLRKRRGIWQKDEIENIFDPLLKEFDVLAAIVEPKAEEELHPAVEAKIEEESKALEEHTEEQVKKNE